MCIRDSSKDNAEVKKNINKSLKEEFARANTAKDYMQLYDAKLRQQELQNMYDELTSMGEVIKDIDISDDAFKGIEAIIYSMTPEERTKPSVINGSRKERIAKGSGTSQQEVNRLMHQFDQMRKMMKQVQTMSVKAEKKNKRKQARRR